VLCNSFVWMTSRVRGLHRYRRGGRRDSGNGGAGRLRCAAEDALHCSHFGRRDRTEAGLRKLRRMAGRSRPADSPALRSGVKADSSRSQVICPLSSHISDFPKDISVPTYPKSHLELFASHPTRGAYHDRHETRGGMRWTRQRFARDGIVGRASVRERSTASGREMLQRTAKSCGPDAPTLVSSSRSCVGPTGLRQNISVGRRWQKSPVTGESMKETVKTIACGNAG
jgi:hypothetical protein